MLQLLPAASALPSREGDGPFNGDIALLHSSLSGRTDIKLVADLLHAIVAQKDSRKIRPKYTKSLHKISHHRNRPLPPHLTLHSHHHSNRRLDPSTLPAS